MKDNLDSNVSEEHLRENVFRLIEKVFRLNQPSFLRFLVHFGLTIEEAEETLATVCVKVLELIMKPGSTGMPTDYRGMTAYFYTAIRNTAKDLLKKKGRDVPLEPDVADSGAPLLPEALRELDNPEQQALREEERTLVEKKEALLKTMQAVLEEEIASLGKKHAALEEIRDFFKALLKKIQAALEDKEASLQEKEILLEKIQVLLEDGKVRRRVEFNRMIDELPRGLKVCFKGSLDRKTHQEIHEQTGYPIKTVEVYISGSRKLLKQALGSLPQYYLVSLELPQALSLEEKGAAQ